MTEFIDELYGQIYVTFIYEERWRFFLEGFGMTLILTFVSFVIGTLIGVLLCRLKRSSSKWLCRITNIITSFFIQVPTMVLLMLFVYVVFAETALPVTIIVIIGLTVKAGCYMSDIFDAAVNTVNPGEIEAARTLGMSGTKTFIYVVLPQTVKTVLPVYKNQFISTLQETSVVGYLAIMDLTRASDIVAARTFDALFALLAITVVYLIIGWTVSAILELAGKKKHLGGETR